jgi:anthranilate phosphoribosyltransferase
METDSSPRLLEALRRALEGEDLDARTAEAAMEEIMAGRASEGRIAGYLIVLRMKGETAEEIVGSARAMRAAARAISPKRTPLLDTCGTGGDGAGTFNISTAAALVAAGAGAAVAKHGNRSVSSRCGSADVLAELGIPIEAEPERVSEMVERHGFGFLMAPAFHVAVRHAMPARKSLGVRTLFNLLGPLANPAGAQRQLVGVFSDSVVDLAAEALRLLGTEKSFVVHSEDGLDELSISSATRMVEVTPRGLRSCRVTPEDFGFERAPLADVLGESARENAAILERIFAGEKGTRRNVVVMNAAVALCAAGVAGDFREGKHRAEDALDAGRVRQLVERLRRESP